MLRGLAQYKVLRCLASGSQGTVFLALDTRLSRRVCIKLYHLNGGLSDRRRAIEEAWQLTRVDSPRTLTVFDVVAHGESLALVTAYIHGCSLHELLQSDTPLPLSNAVAIVSDLAVALTSLRQARLVHGDLSARNVLIDFSGRAVLADFGTASWSGEGVIGLSEDAMSPEQSRGELIDLRSDFFALGLLLFRMVHGRHPFCRRGAGDRAGIRAGNRAGNRAGKSAGNSAMNRAMNKAVDGAMDNAIDSLVDTQLLAKGLRSVDVLAGADPTSSQAINSLLLTLLAASPSDRPSGTFELREQLRRIRTLLPAPSELRDEVRRAVEQRPRVEGSLRLPIKLVKLPFRHHLRAWLQGFWSSGSLGARALFAVLAALPAVTLLLFLLRPGICMEIEPSQIKAPVSLRERLPDDDRLHELLSQGLHSAASRAAVLGWGAVNESGAALSRVGVRDRCTAQRSLRLLIECSGDHCLFQTRATTPERLEFRELTLQVYAGVIAMENAVRQLASQQAAFLLED